MDNKNKREHRVYYWWLQEVGIEGAFVLSHVECCERETPIGACVDNLSYIANLGHMSRSAVKRALKLLCKRGFLTIESVDGNGWSYKEGGWKLNLTQVVRDRL